MIYFVPIFLILVLWFLCVTEIKAETPNEKNMKFYRIIAVSFTFMQLFVIPVAPNLLTQFISILVILISIVFTFFMCIPVDKMPDWYTKLIRLPSAKKEMVSVSPSLGVAKLKTDEQEQNSEKLDEDAR